MALFNFGNKQRLHTQMFGETSGREMFKIDEYNHIKKTTIILGAIMLGIFTLFYFGWSLIPAKIKLFLALIFIGCGIWEYYNVKHQIRVKESLY